MYFFFSSRRRHTRLTCDWSSDVCSSDLLSIRTAPLTPLKEPPRVAGNVSGAGPVFLVKDTGQESLFAARYRLGSFTVEIAERAFRVGGEEFSAGSWILPAKEGLAGTVHSVASELGLDFVCTSSVPDVARHAA